MAREGTEPAMASLYDLGATDIRGRQVELGDYRGQVLLIVNTASKCGFTPQYGGLQALQDRYQAQGFSVLGFPCNQFMGQEPGGAEEISGFCAVNYGVSFPMFEKIDVNGPDTHPLFGWLKAQAPGLLGSRAIKWNFTKFLVSRDGATVERFAPNASPESLAPAIERALASPAAA